jgi:hypothetical protein
MSENLVPGHLRQIHVDLRDVGQRLTVVEPARAALHRGGAALADAHLHGSPRTDRQGEHLGRIERRPDNVS